jgi:hypothetical protein
MGISSVFLLDMVYGGYQQSQAMMINRYRKLGPILINPYSLISGLLIGLSTICIFEKYRSAQNEKLINEFMKTQHLVEELESILAKDGKWIKN